MQISVQGKNLDIGDALRSHIDETLQTGVEKYFPDPQEGAVTISKDGRLISADITVRIGRDIILRGSADAGDAYGAFDEALEHLGKRLRRYKRRLRDHHQNRTDSFIEAQQYVLSAEEDDNADEPATDGSPAIIAEMSTAIETLSVGEAVMRMDLADLPVVMFRNKAHSGMNVVYRRADGTIGWIDPILSETIKNR
ncbi:MAG: ribosome-associated translation inhibitor RaiA [Rhodospirillales bacterium]|nr:ribosome-associated translation inhibitor RaiA [Rhodospirillales bacterium]MCW8862408.1 ribosome-associated translation inhibitor RaiA [Rhodospirillales bacterium]MCW9001566.1 ribosome-associated translation inhibitor RaiA [Rhodospirillales bacterium]MCW9039843.1 ribosome-associated translation inhibitor RaiA [Rhodospirillales bacterium]